MTYHNPEVSMVNMVMLQRRQEESHPLEPSLSVPTVVHKERVCRNERGRALEVTCIQQPRSDAPATYRGCCTSTFDTSYLLLTVCLRSIGVASYPIN